MRIVFAVAVAIVVAACALQQSSSDGFLDGGSRAAQVARDADAIMRGMAQAQQSSQRVARETGRDGGAGPTAITR